LQVDLRGRSIFFSARQHVRGDHGKLANLGRGARIDRSDRPQGALCGAARLRMTPCACQHIAEIRKRDGVCRVDRNRGAKTGFCLDVVSKIAQHIAEDTQRLDMARLKCERLAQHQLGLLGMLQRPQHAAERRQRLDRGGAKLQRFLQALRRRLILLQLALAQCEVLVELGILRLADNGLAQRAERLIEAPLGAQRDTQHLMQDGRAACGLDGGARPHLHLGKTARSVKRHQFLDWIGEAGRFHRGPKSDRCESQGSKRARIEHQKAMARWIKIQDRSGLRVDEARYDE